MAQSIGQYNERSLHREVIEYLLKPGDSVEVKVDGYIVDILRSNGDIWEVQTGNFSALRTKLKRLLKTQKVTLVYPIIRTKNLVNVDPETGEIIKRRKSPRKGRLLDIFNEVIRIPKLTLNKGFRLNAILVVADEIRCSDGKGSWRRKGVSIIDRKLVSVEQSFMFENPESYLNLLPIGLADQFTSADLASALVIPRSIAQRMVYCLKHMEVLEITKRDKFGYHYKRVK